MRAEGYSLVGNENLSTYRYTQKLCRIHCRINLIGNILIRVCEVLQRSRFHFQPLHCLIKCQCNAPHGVVSQGRFLVSFRVSLIINIKAFFLKNFIQSFAVQFKWKRRIKRRKISVWQLSIKLRKGENRRVLGYQKMVQNEINVMETIIASRADANMLSENVFFLNIVFASDGVAVEPPQLAKRQKYPNFKFFFKFYFSVIFNG